MPLLITVSRYYSLIRIKTLKNVARLQGQDVSVLFFIIHVVIYSFVQQKHAQDNKRILMHRNVHNYTNKYSPLFSRDFSFKIEIDFQSIQLIQEHLNIN